MNNTRLEFKVGLFVAVGLGLVALLILNFSRGVTLFKSTYQLHLLMPTTGGLKSAADVMLLGVPIGKVSDLDFAPNGHSVEVTVRVLSKYKISKTSGFHVDALGFLGDQYIDVSPPTVPLESTTNAADFYQDGDTVVLSELPFNMQEAARSTAGLLDEAKLMMKDLDKAITNVNRTVLSGPTLTNFSLAMSNFQALTEVAVQVAQGVQDFVHSNRVPLSSAVTNARAFSAKLNVIADNFDQVILTNRGNFSETMQNLRDTTASLKQLTTDLEAGKGLAGGLLKDEEMKAELTALLSNANATAAALSTFGSNLNQRGLWRMLWKPKPNERNPAPPP
jgi:phospholipid/cholesterol/gamma-HCH transport system substrate-binding protein